MSDSVRPRCVGGHGAGSPRRPEDIHGEVHAEEVPRALQHRGLGPGHHGTETDDEDRPVAYNRVAGVVVTGIEDGAHHAISEISGALADVGYTIPGEAWAYWHFGPGPDYLEERRGREWSHQTGRAMGANLYGVDQALAARPLGAAAVARAPLRHSNRTVQDRFRVIHASRPLAVRGPRSTLAALAATPSDTVEAGSASTRAAGARMPGRLLPPSFPPSRRSAPWKPGHGRSPHARDSASPRTRPGAGAPVPVAPDARLRRHLRAGGRGG